MKSRRWNAQLTQIKQYVESCARYAIAAPELDVDRNGLLQMKEYDGSERWCRVSRSSAAATY